MTAAQPYVAAQARLAPRAVLHDPVRQPLIKIGVIGYGYWGPKLVRNMNEIHAATVHAVADLSSARLAQVRTAHPDITTTQDYRELLASDIDAVIIATPVPTHYPLAMECLSHGKHVLVEKPLACTSAHGKELIDAAASRGLILMVGHTFEYNPAVELLREIVASGEIGRVYYIHSARTNLGIFQKDINVLWDLAPHDISILQYVLGLDPIGASACGEAYIQSGIHDVARLTLFFPNQIQAHIHLSWLDPCKVRRTTIVGEKKMIVYDDVVTQEKIKIYDTGVHLPTDTDNYGEFQLSYRFGDITIPHIPLHEPLKVECLHFVDCILNGWQPRSDGVDGLKVVKVLESAQHSLTNGGTREPVIW